jgi:poly-gamma-glutamate synthesis protein (capsule biosynthesis protein)
MKAKAKEMFKYAKNILYKDYYTKYQEIDKDRINSILKAVEAEKPDLTIAMLHWGSEYNDTVYDTQKDIVYILQKGGVDVIIGSHPHRVQHVEYDELTGNLVAYSLGDFFGDGKKDGTFYSILLKMEITKDYETGVTRVTDWGYEPIYTLSEAECDGDRRVIRIDNAISAYDMNFVDKVTAACYDNLKFSMDRISARIVPPADNEK